MKTLFATLFLVITALHLRAAEEPLAKELEPLRPFIGKTWKGHFKDSTPEKPKVDIAKWERALNGKGVRILHSVNNGSYGGESIIMWNQKSQQIEFHYFTTAGFTTHGTMKVEGKKLVTREIVTGDNVTEVEATTELRPDGKLHVTSRHLKNGEGIGGREMIYEEAPNAEVIFK